MKKLTPRDTWRQAPRRPAQKITPVALACATLALLSADVLAQV